MGLTNGNFELGAFLFGLTKNLLHQQVRLNHDYEKSLDGFRSILQLARSLGYEEVARTIAPSQMILNRAEVHVEIRLAETREQEFALSVRPINLGYSRKYKHSQFVRNTLRIEVRSIPLPQAEPPKAAAP